jgi:hypothetical protein
MKHSLSQKRDRQNTKKRPPVRAGKWPPGWLIEFCFVEDRAMVTINGEINFVQANTSGETFAKTHLKVPSRFFF